MTSKESKETTEPRIRKREPVTVKLQYPVEFDNKIYEEITLQRPKGKHLKKMNKDAGLEDLLVLACKVTGIPNKVFEEMDGADCITIAEQLGDFLESGQKIGKL